MRPPTSHPIHHRFRSSTVSEPSHMRVLRDFLRVHPLVATAVLLLGLAAAAGGVQEPAIPPGAGIQSWHENGAGGRYIVRVTEGSVSGSHVATVLTDENCTPDRMGLSHCRNAVRLDDGSQLTIQNNHQMSRHRCLESGEKVRVTELAGRWVTLQIGE